MLRVQCIKRHEIRHFYYYFPWWKIFNGVSSDPNADSMQKIHPQEVDVPTYHFWVNKTIGVSYLGSCLRYTISKGDVVPFHMVLLGYTFPMVYWATQTKMICKSYSSKKLTYKPTISSSIKLLKFPLLGSHLWLTIDKGMV